MNLFLFFETQESAYQICSWYRKEPCWSLNTATKLFLVAGVERELRLLIQIFWIALFSNSPLACLSWGGGKDGRSGNFLIGLVFQKQILFYYGSLLR